MEALLLETDGVGRTLYYVKVMSQATGFVAKCVDSETNLEAAQYTLSLSQVCSFFSDLFFQISYEIKVEKGMSEKEKHALSIPSLQLIVATKTDASMFS